MFSKVQWDDDDDGDCGDGSIEHWSEANKEQHCICCRWQKLVCVASLDFTNPSQLELKWLWSSLLCIVKHRIEWRIYWNWIYPKSSLLSISSNVWRLWRLTWRLGGSGRCATVQSTRKLIFWSLVPFSGEMPKKLFSPAWANYRCVLGREARQIPENFEFSPALIKSNKKKTQQRVKLSIR